VTEEPGVYNVKMKGPDFWVSFIVGLFLSAILICFYSLGELGIGANERKYKEGVEAMLPIPVALEKVDEFFEKEARKYMGPAFRVLSFRQTSSGK